MPDENTVKFECRHCAQSIEAPAEMLGVEIDCPSCGKRETVQRLVVRPDTSQVKPVPGIVARCLARLVCLLLGDRVRPDAIEGVARAFIPLVCLLPLLWFDWDFWKSKGQSAFEREGQEIIVFFFLVWVAVAWSCTPTRERGRFGAVLGCGIMVVAWWGLKSIPCVIIGGVVLLFGLTGIIARAVNAARTR